MRLTPATRASELSTLLSSLDTVTTLLVRNMDPALRQKISQWSEEVGMASCSAEHDTNNAYLEQLDSHFRPSDSVAAIERPETARAGDNRALTEKYIYNQGASSSKKSKKQTDEQTLAVKASK